MVKNANNAARGRFEGHSFAALVSLLVSLVTLLSEPVFAQDSNSACSPVVGRLVAIQGEVEIRRRSGTSWSPIDQLDSPVCAGDLLRTRAGARAAVFVQPETIVRIDQSTTVTLTQTPVETVVEFFRDELTSSAEGSQACGAGYFVSRFPKKLRVKTPFLNAVVEGTEFHVLMQCDSNELVVVEGAVRSQALGSSADHVLTSGKSLLVSAAAPPVVNQVVKPANAVRWVIYYPSLSGAPSGRSSLEVCRALPSEPGRSCFLQRAESLFRAGLNEDALRTIDEVVARHPNDGDFRALQAIIMIAANDGAAALDAARGASTLAPNSYRAWLALSYAQQSRFDLDAALDSARKALALAPSSALINARVAELLLSVGRINEAAEAARAAVDADPIESLGHTVLGFTQLARMDTKAARVAFQTAIERSSFEPLPRLGLGLAIIRDGDLAQGREQLEIAVALDPTNSLLRSYVGKAYYEENTKERNDLAAVQLALAKEYDTNDPTPWFYDAILKYSSNEPVVSLEQLNASVQRNANRAVSRSRLLLDDDQAARTASTAAVYKDLGFERLAIVESTRAIDANASNSSAHELLATAYANLPRYDIARASEALQAQITRPLSLTPISPLLTTDNLAIARDTGPSRSGASEYNALFNQSGVRLELDGVSGSRGTWGDQVVASALTRKTSLALSQVHYETEGFTDHDSSERDLYGVFVHHQFAWNSAVQLEVRRSEFEVEENFFAFDPDFSLPVAIEERGDSIRLNGFHVAWLQSDWLWTAVREDRERTVTFTPDGSLFVDTDTDAYGGEMQQQRTWGPVRTVAGVSYVKEEDDFQLESVRVKSTATNAYVYGTWHLRNVGLDLHAGLSGDRYSQSHSPRRFSVSRSKLNPKLGLVWSPRPGSTLRVAALSAVRRPFIRSQTIEPTQIAGFNQYFSGFEDLYGDVEGTVSKRAAFAFDQRLTQSLFAGVEVSERRLDVPSLILNRDFEWEETAYLAYLYRTFRIGNWQAAAFLEGEYEDIDRPQILTGSEGIMDLRSLRVPIGIRVFDASGLSLRLATTYVDQSGTFSLDVGFPEFEKKEDGWISDVALDYRLPRRRGVVSLILKNIGDNRIDLLEIDPLNPRAATRRLALVKLRLTL